MHFLKIILGIALLAVSPSFAQADSVELVMVEELGCVWCATWDEEIAPIYPKTAESRVAPLRRIDLHDDRPSDIEFQSSLRITPTFVLIEDGKEIARLEGYPGEDFFWGLLGRMLAKLTTVNWEAHG